MSTGTKASQITARSIPFVAFQALWIPGTTRVCSLGSNDGGFGVIQVHALSSTTSTSSTVSPVTELQPPRLVLHSETEKRIQFKSGTFRASARSSSSPHLLAGDFEGQVGLWDLSRTEVPLRMFRAHEDVVNCMDGAGSQTGRPEFVTGGRDGAVRLWDMRQNHKDTAGVLPISDMSPRKGQECHDVWCVALGGSGSGIGAQTGPSADDLMIAAGYDNGDVRVIDVRMGRTVFETSIKHGVCAVEFDKREGKTTSLIATSLEGAMHSFDIVDGQFQANGTTEEVVAVQSGDDSTLWQVRHVPQRPDIFAVTDGGGSIHMYQHGDGSTAITSRGSHRFAPQGLLSLDFNEDLEGLFVACDLENNLRVGIVQF